MSLNERVLAAIGRHAPVTRGVRFVVLALSEDALRAYLRIAFHEIGEVLRDDERTP